MSYSALVERHFLTPRNVGALAAASDVIAARRGAPAQGIEIELSGGIADGRLIDLKQRVYGCPHAIAAASWLTERLAGASLADLDAWSWREAADALEVPPEKWGRLLVLEDAVRALAREWRGRL
jgi:NifU-like protein involved in Fe-S cluster formation